MMYQVSDERLVAFLDGELDEAAFTEIEEALAHDPALRDHLAALSETTALIRRAFDDVLHEAVPERLLAAALAPPPAAAQIIQLPQRSIISRNRWASFAIAASLLGIVVGTPIGYFAADTSTSSTNQAPSSSGPVSSLLDTIASYHNLFISSADGAENTVFDVPAGAEKRLPVDIRVPNLQPYDLAFRGARRIVLDGRPAYQFFYGASDHKVSATTLFITDTQKPEMTPTFERRDNVNILYWRHLGHAYAIVGQADRGMMSGLANDIAFQLQTK